MRAAAVGSGLLVRSFAQLLTVDTGFAPHQLLTFQINLIGERYQQNAAITQFFDDLTARLRATPGVVNVSSSSMLPLTDSMAQMTVRIEGRPIENPAAAPRADTYAVAPGLFRDDGRPRSQGPPIRIHGRRARGPRRHHRQDDGRGVVAGRGSHRPPHPRSRGTEYPLRTIVGVVGDVKISACTCR